MLNAYPSKGTSRDTSTHSHLISRPQTNKQTNKQTLIEFFVCLFGGSCLVERVASWSREIPQPDRLSPGPDASGLAEVRSSSSRTLKPYLIWGWDVAVAKAGVLVEETVEGRSGEACVTRRPSFHTDIVHTK